MAKTKHIISLNDTERKMLQSIVNDNTESDRTILRAKILLMSDTSNEEKLSIPKIADRLGTTHTTVQTTRTEYAKGGVEGAVYRKTRTVDVMKRKINSEVTKQILELAAENPPEGYKRWSIRLLCRVCIERGIIDYIGPTSMRKIVNNGTTSKLED